MVRLDAKASQPSPNALSTAVLSRCRRRDMVASTFAKYFGVFSSGMSLDSVASEYVGANS